MSMINTIVSPNEVLFRHKETILAKPKDPDDYFLKKKLTLQGSGEHQNSIPKPGLIVQLINNEYI